MFSRGLIAVLVVGLSCGWIEAQQTSAPSGSFERVQADQRKARADDVIYRETKRGPEDKSLSPSLSKEAVERVKQFRKVDPHVAAGYSDFLKTQNTGINKIFAKNDCQAAGVINSSERCRDFIPDTYAFTFRAKGYAREPYGDITFYDNRIFTGGFFAQGAIVPVGDVPIEAIDLNHAAAKLLSALPREKDFAAAKEGARRLKQGYSEDGMPVTTVARSGVNTTYVVRVIAYKSGTFVPPLSDKSTTMEKWFLSLDNDTRGDILAAFRIVNAEPGGAMTVVWKLLDRKDAPKLKFGKDEPLADFRQ